MSALNEAKPRHHTEATRAVTMEQINLKYAGTNTDRADMELMGRTQELRRSFKFAWVLGFGCTLIGTWNFFLGLIAFGLTDGGTAGLIYGFIVCFAGFCCVYLSIAEMASMAPSSGGRKSGLRARLPSFQLTITEYHRVSLWAPPSYRKYLSYVSGYLVAIGWQGSICSTAFLAGTITQGLITLNDDNYNPQPYQGTLLVWAIMAFCVFFNVFMAKRLPIVENTLLVTYILGFFAILIPLWVLGPRADARQVFTTFNNAGDWSSTGIAFMVGLGGIVPSLAGYDCAIHMGKRTDVTVTVLLILMCGQPRKYRMPPLLYLELSSSVSL